MVIYAEIQKYTNIMLVGFVQEDVQLWEPGTNHHIVTTMAQKALAEFKVIKSTT